MGDLTLTQQLWCLIGGTVGLVAILVWVLATANDVKGFRVEL